MLRALEKLVNREERYWSWLLLLLLFLLLLLLGWPFDAHALASLAL